MYYTSVLLKNQKITFGFTVRQRNKSHYYKQLSNSEIPTIYRKAKLSELYGLRWLTTSGWYITIYKPTLNAAYNLNTIKYQYGVIDIPRSRLPSLHNG